MPISIIVDDGGTTTAGSGPTRGDLVEEILSNVQGFTASPDQVTSLTSPLTATATSLKVDSAAGIAGGMIEVGDELMWVSSFDSTSGDVRLLPKGRGWRGTAAAEHASGETVVVSPTIPRSAVVRELNNQIRSLYPRIFAVSQETWTFTDVTKVAHVIPATAEMVLDVRYLDINANWQRVRKWEVEFTPGSVPSLRFVGVPLGHQVQVVYGLRLTPLEVDDALLGDTGLDTSAKDLLVNGVIARLLPMIDVAKLGVQHAVADEFNHQYGSARQLGSASTLAAEFQKLFQQRLLEVQTALQIRYPGRVHFTR